MEENIHFNTLNLSRIIKESRLQSIRTVVAYEYMVEYYYHEPTNTTFSIGGYPILTDDDPTIHEIFGRKRNVRKLMQLLTQN